MNQVAGHIGTGNSVICLVGQDAGERRDLVRLLERLGREIRCVDSGEALLAQLPQDRQFVLIAAINLPGINGMDLLKELRNRGLDCPTILISEESDIPTAVDAMRAGATDFIERPYIDRVLLRRVQAALEDCDQR